jgi:AraC family transcriptional regulator
MIINVKTGKVRPAMPRAPVLSSAGTPWHGVLLEQFSGGPVEVRDVAPLNHVVVLQVARATTIEWIGGAGPRETRVLPGQSGLFPAMHAHSARNRDTGEFLTVSLEPKFLRRAVHDVVGPERIELVPTFGIDDPLMRGVGLALKAEVETGHPGGRWYGEFLANTLAVHLVRHYSAQKSAVKITGGGLGRRQLTRAIEFIHEHFAEDVPLGALAAVAGLSPYHFARLFKQSTGLAPHQYLIQVRVDRAKGLLLGSEASITDAALQAGFCDQSHFAAHFKRIYGLTPKAFLRQVGLRKTIL